MFTFQVLHERLWLLPHEIKNRRFVFLDVLHLLLKFVDDERPELLFLLLLLDFLAALLDISLDLLDRLLDALCRLGFSIHLGETVVLGMLFVLTLLKHLVDLLPRLSGLLCQRMLLVVLLMSCLFLMVVSLAFVMGLFLLRLDHD